MLEFTNDMSWSQVLVPGTIIWRECLFGRDEASLLPCPFRYSSAYDIWQAKATCRINGTAEFVAYSGKGLFIHSRTQPPPNWTHLLVTDYTASAKSPGLTGRGVGIRVAAAKPHADYLDFRLRMMKAIRCKTFDAQVATVVSGDDGYCYAPDEDRPNECRLMLQYCEGVPYRGSRLIEQGSERYILV